MTNTITVTEFVQNKIETTILCDDKGTYTKQEIHSLIVNAIEDYEYEFNTTVSNLSDVSFSTIHNYIVNEMNITLI